MKNSSVIRHKGESQNGDYKKTKHTKLAKKRTFFTPLIRTRTGFFVLSYYQRIRNASPEMYLKVAILIVTKNYLENNNTTQRRI